MNLSTEVENILAEARNKALLFRHSYIGTEHILFALVTSAPEEFEVFGVKAIDVLKELVLRIAPAPIDVQVAAGLIKYTPNTMKALKAAVAVAEDEEGVEDAEITVEYLILALLESEDTIASEVLETLGADWDPMVIEDEDDEDDYNLDEFDDEDDDDEEEDEEDDLDSAVEAVEGDYEEAITELVDRLGEPNVKLITATDGVVLTLSWAVV